MLNLGTIQFGLAIDTRALTAAKNRVEEFGRSVSQMQQAANRGSDTQIAQFRKQENAILSSLEKLKSATNAIANAKISPSVKTQMIEEAGRAYNNLTKSIGQAGKAADATKFDRNLAAYNASINDMRRALSNLPKDDGSREKAILRQANAYERAAETVRNLNAQIERSKLNTDVTTRLTTGNDRALASFGSKVNTGVPLDAKAMSAATNSYRADIGVLRRQFQGLLSESEKLPASVEKWRNSLKSLGASVLLVNGHLGGMSTRLFAVGQIMGNTSVAVGAAAATLTGFGLAAYQLGAGAVRTSIQIEKATQALVAVRGEAVSAGVELEYIKRVSDQAGQSFLTNAQSYARFAISAREAGMSIKEVQREFSTISLASGKLSLSVEETQNVFLALEQMMSKGKVQSEELRKQLGNALPGAFELAAKAMGVSTSGLDDMMKKGKLLTSDFLPKFVTQIEKSFGVNASTRIETTQAAIQRLSNKTTDLYVAFDNSTQVVAVFKAGVEKLSAALVYITNNMDSIVQTAVGLTGALLGIAAATAGLAVIGGIISLYQGFALAVGGIATATELWAAAQLFLNAAMAANPIGGVLMLLGKLVIVIGGAVLGYKAMQTALAASNVALADTTSADLFIASQKNMRTATDEATDAIIKQTKAKLAAALAAHREATKKVKSVQDDFNERNQGANKFQRKTNNILLAPVAAEAVKELNETTNAVKAQSKALQELGIIRSKPIQQASVIHNVLDEDGADKVKKLRDNVDKIKDLVNEYNAAMGKLDSLSTAKNKSDLNSFEDLAKAQNIINSFNPKELAQLPSILAKAGFATGDLTADLTKMIWATRIANEQSQAFISVWQNIDRDLTGMSGLQKQIEYLQSGGDPRNLFIIQAATDAKEALSKITLPASLDALREKLKALGFEGKTAEEALTKFFQSGDKKNKLVSALSDVANAMVDIQKRLEAATLATAGFSQNAWVGEWVEKMTKNKQAAEEFGKALIAAGMSAADAQAEVSKLYGALNSADSAEASLDRLKQHAEDFKQMWKTTAQDATANIMSVIQGTKKLGAAITDFFMGIVNRGAENALNNLFDNLLENVFGGKKSQSQAAATMQNTSSLDKNTQALQQLATSLGVSATASGGGGTLGGIANAIGGAISGSGGKGSGIFGSIISGIGGLFGAPAGKRAFGGPVTAGFGYQVSEQGVGREIFYPGQSGSIIPASKLGGMGGGSPVHIDARTTIDARGATQENINTLRSEMIERERRLHQQLPAMIDQRTMDSRYRGRTVD